MVFARDLTFPRLQPAVRKIRRPESITDKFSVDDYGQTGRMRYYGQRSGKGKHIRHRDYSQVIAGHEAAHLANAGCFEFRSATKIMNTPPKGDTPT